MTALYRHFDADWHLLYVGISRSVAARLATSDPTAPVLPRKPKPLPPAPAEREMEPAA